MPELTGRRARVIGKGGLFYGEIGNVVRVLPNGMLVLALGRAGVIEFAFQPSEIEVLKE